MDLHECVAETLLGVDRAWIWSCSASVVTAGHASRTELSVPVVMVDPVSRFRIAGQVAARSWIWLWWCAVLVLVLLGVTLDLVAFGLHSGGRDLVMLWMGKAWHDRELHITA